MILSQEEVEIKSKLWFAENGDFLKEQECKLHTAVGNFYSLSSCTIPSKKTETVGREGPERETKKGVSPYNSTVQWNPQNNFTNVKK